MGRLSAKEKMSPLSHSLALVLAIAAVHVQVEARCSKGYWACPGMGWICIPSSNVCDGYPNCPNGGDEENCDGGGGGGGENCGGGSGGSSVDNGSLFHGWKPRSENCRWRAQSSLLRWMRTKNQSRASLYASAVWRRQPTQ